MRRPPSVRGRTLGLCLLVLATLRGVIAATEAPAPVRFAFSRDMFADVNHNDAQAAIRIYSRTIAAERGLVTAGNSLLLDGTNAIVRALELFEFDLLSVPTDKFFALEPRGLAGPFILTQVASRITDEYVLLVRDAGPYQSIADLRGASVVVLRDFRTFLADTWWDSLYRQHRLGTNPATAPKVTSATKATGAILPVFFGKADACVVTLNALQIMGELNPQVKTRLRTLAVSPPLVSSVTCFHPQVPNETRRKVVEAATHSTTSPAFRQMRALFKFDTTVVAPLDVLTNTRAFLAEYHRLCESGPLPAPASASLTPAR